MPRSKRDARDATASAAGNPQLSGNVPQQTYSGQNIIELRLPTSWFIATAAGAGAEKKEEQS
ncbi:hypothetical protein AB0M36_24295 [Actinoplanes sp. NPDC051346]|uniref:hypothetical protein n=1 Tax=Actinoplanes sp. NPDC051346 TaxID=3155048 RepID=UPI0034335F7B